MSNHYPVEYLRLHEYYLLFKYCMLTSYATGTMLISYFLWKLSFSILAIFGDSCLRQFSSVTQSCPTLCDAMDCNMPGFPVHHQFPEFAQTHVHRVSDAIQLSHLLPSPSPPALKLSQHWGLFQGVSSLYHVAKVLEFQLQHQSFQWIFRVDFL